MGSGCVPLGCEFIDFVGVDFGSRGPRGIVTVGYLEFRWHDAILGLLDLLDELPVGRNTKLISRSLRRSKVRSPSAANPYSVL